MHLNKDFKLVNKSKYVIWSFIGFIWLCAIVLFTVTTSRFKYDNAISEFFYRAMDYKFFRGWGTYFVNDANLLIISILVPVFFVLIESLYAYKKKYSPNSFGAIHYKDKRWFYYVLYVVFPIFSFFYMASFSFADYGFGHGYDYMNIAGLRYTIPTFIVSFLVDNAIFFALMYYVRYDAAKREDFLESRMWERAFVDILLTILIYLVVLILKNGFERPYWYNLHWKEYVGRIAIDDHSAYEHYMTGQGANPINWGWAGNGKLDDNFPDTNWPWYKVAHGFFKPHGEIYQNTPWSDAFPSGHMGMTSIVLCALWYVLFGDSKDKKHQTLRWIIIAVGMLYFFNLFFTLLIDLGHWASDLSFTIMYAPIAFIASKYIVRGIIIAVKKNYADSFNALK